jgi:hypothetical protein
MPVEESAAYAVSSSEMRSTRLRCAPLKTTIGPIRHFASWWRGSRFRLLEVYSPKPVDHIPYLLGLSYLQVIPSRRDN